MYKISMDQGCHIFLGIIYQNGKNIPNGHKMYQMAIKYTNIFHYIPKLAVLGFRGEDIPFGNRAWDPFIQFSSSSPGGVAHWTSHLPQEQEDPGSKSRQGKRFLGTHSSAVVYQMT
jgi:hypothetical protein